VVETFGAPFIDRSGALPVAVVPRSSTKGQDDLSVETISAEAGPDASRAAREGLQLI